MAICWAIWKARNAMVFEHKTIDIQGTLEIALYWYNLFFNFTDDEEVQISENNQAVDNTSWKSPSHPYIKINVDATWKNGVYACAAAVRDCNGICCVAGSRVGRTDSVVYAEADSFKLVADLAIWLNVNHIIVEGDSQVLVKSLNGELRKVPWKIWRLKKTSQAR
ncbi:uncharacterized protein LOC113352358 [Papaver somniferum]|uniref:uncharacterized protein LOC113352358 n=1 Tax=Papaver somniferum TaxID=3469 RepID=UPI000E6F528C|nr:uncharacterized protein LOC113352358 [Papaver somniferum]